MDNRYNYDINGEYSLEITVPVGEENEIDIEEDRFKIFNVSDNDYTKLKNKPQINGIELVGNKQFKDLGISEISNVELDNIFKDL